MSFGLSLIDTLFPFLFLTIFAIVIGTFVVTAIRGLSQWRKNNASPVLDVPAKVVAKRSSVTHHHNDHGGHSTTRYYATFEFPSGDRLELAMSGSEFGMLAEGDVGMLTFQGTRYQGFLREK